MYIVEFENTYQESWDIVCKALRSIEGLEDLE